MKLRVNRKKWSSAFAEYCEMNRDWISEAEYYLGDLLRQTCDHRKLAMPTSGPLLRDALTEHEAKYFLLGLEAGLFRVDINSYVQSPLMPPKTKRATEQRMCQLVWTGTPAYFFREGICQLSTASSLILEHGHDINRIEMEPCKGIYKGQKYGVDIVVKSSGNRVFLCVEVKRNAKELDALIAGFRRCCELGAHRKPDCLFPNAHAKYEFCRVHQPNYFWAVSPARNICFRLQEYPDKIRVEEVAFPRDF